MDINYKEPVHDISVRTTATSNSEGRLKVGNKSKRRKILKKKLRNY